MEGASSQTMIATVAAVDSDNSPQIDIGDELTIQTSSALNHQELKTGDWVIVRNPNIRRGLYLVRQYWPTKNGAMLVACNPAIPAHPVTDEDAIDGRVIDINKAHANRVLAH